MNNKPIIKLFEENELNIAALYSLYAQKIPEKKAFWNRLSNEEISHAAKIGYEKGSADAILENKFSKGIINYVMSFVLDETKKAQNNDVSHADALRTALRVEQSMLEKKCFEMFTPANKTVKELFCKLNVETERHIEVLMKESKKNKIALDHSSK
jgi:hypothetical protein